MTLAELGWTDTLAQAFAPHAAPGVEPARVVVELRRHYYAVQTATGEFLGELTGKFHHGADREAQAYPAVGDWVAVQVSSDGRRAQIHALLPRRTRFSRQAAGEAQVEQIVAANIDTVFLVSGLDANYNPKRIQRFFVAARDSGAQPVIILNKSDLCDNPDIVREEIELLVPGVPVLITSTHTRKGIKSLVETYALPGRTLAFVGSSGAGKSTIINRLLKDSEAMPTGEVREKDGKGRHTTTRRELMTTPSGALVIDTPGSNSGIPRRPWKTPTLMSLESRSAVVSPTAITTPSRAAQSASLSNQANSQPRAWKVTENSKPNRSPRLPPNASPPPSLANRVGAKKTKVWRRIGIASTRKTD